MSIELDEEYIVLVSQLDNNSEIFNKTYPEMSLEFIDDKSGYICSGDSKTECSWEFLGVYQKNDENVYWQWSWDLIDNDVKLATEQLPDGMNLMKQPKFTVNDPMLISVLFAYLMHLRNYDHIYVYYNSEQYSAFGLKK